MLRRAMVVVAGAAMLLAGAQVASAGVNSGISIAYNTDNETFTGR